MNETMNVNDSTNEEDNNEIAAIYKEYQQRKDSKRIKFESLYNDDIFSKKKWYEIWKYF